MSAEIHIATGLAKIGTYLRSESWRQAEGESLTPTQSQILVHVVQRGPARVTALADVLGVTQPTASDAAAALIRKGHVKRRPDPADARASLLHTTSSGRDIAAKMAVWPDALLAAADALDPFERGVFLKALTKMIRSLQVQGAVPVQRMCATCAFFRPNVHNDPVAPHHCAFVDAAFGDAALRLDCGDHETAPASQAAAAWQAFALAGAKSMDAPPAATGEAS
ncbi:MAG: MarR family winged helix-turn-helix transcriptional regulator [Pseudomonadota bacterium]